MVDNMSIADIEKYNRLLEVYGGLLSDRAREILSDYITYGLSITEIADARNVSKQSVSTTIRRALRNLERYEEVLGMLSLIDMAEVECPDILDRWMKKTRRGGEA
jgi:hypothetical protein